MSTRLYIGNLPYTMTDNDLAQLFASAGEVKTAEVVRDRETGQSKGFGFVEMKDAAGAEKALQMNGATFQNRQIRVDAARPREPREGGSGSVSYTHLRAHATVLELVCRLLLEKKDTSKP